jgi:hypothetical protein
MVREFDGKLLDGARVVFSPVRGFLTELDGGLVGQLLLAEGRMPPQGDYLLSVEGGDCLRIRAGAGTVASGSKTVLVPFEIVGQETAPESPAPRAGAPGRDLVRKFEGKLLAGGRVLLSPVSGFLNDLGGDLRGQLMLGEGRAVPQGEYLLALHGGERLRIRAGACTFVSAGRMVLLPFEVLGEETAAEG